MPGLYLGLRYQFEYIKLDETDAEGVLRRRTVPGSEGGWASGLGVALGIVVVSHLISIATGLSVASIATNRTVGAGGR